MELRPVAKHSASRAVFEQLFGAVVGGSLAPGQNLPAERALTETLKVNRQAVREALQRLAQAGLVSISQGESTRVLDYRRSAGLDLLPHLLASDDGEPDVAVVRSVMEMRAAIGPDVARLAAERIAPDRAAELEAIAGSMRATSDLDELASLDLDFWDLLVDAADNIAYRLAFNSLRAVYEPLRSELSPALSEELTDRAARERIAVAIRVGDGAKASATARRLLGKGTNAINQLIATTEEAQR